ncbi:putative rab5-interacting protein [Helianthus debilis subsp. tardiflorus]
MPITNPRYHNPQFNHSSTTNTLSFSVLQSNPSLLSSISQLLIFFNNCVVTMSIKEKKSTKLKQHQNGHLSPFKFAKLLDPEADWDKDQLGDVLHWIRQIVALVCGLLWGAFPLVGGIWVVA